MGGKQTEHRILVILNMLSKTDIKLQSMPFTKGIFK